MKSVRNILISTSIVSLLLTVNSCGKKPGDEGAGKDSVTVQNVKVMTIQESTIDRRTNYATTLEAIEQVHLVPTMPGKIQKINVEVGTRVSKGQTLVEMDQTSLYNARVLLANAKTEFNRMKILLESGSISKQVYDNVKAQYDVAEANVENLERNTNIRAPFSGIISGKYLEAGEMYSGAPTTPTGKAAIVSLVQISSLKAMINIPESNYAQVKQGQLVTITSELYPEKEIMGRILRVYPTIDPTSHTFQLEISIPNPNEELKPGMYCTASVDLGKVSALLIPSQAILKTQGSNERFIFVNDKGKARRVKVLLGQRVDDQVEIISEQIKVGDQLVIEGQGRLKNGNQLKIVK